MPVGSRLRQLREHKGLSQRDIEKRTGLLRCYISRVENGHTIPSIPTLERLAHALEVPMYQLFYEGDKPPELSPIASAETKDEWGTRGKSARFWQEIHALVTKMASRDRKLILGLTQKAALRERAN